ncbi:hypothetical protein K490DRAFT_44655 [Saccharata proteae CBS 121410]|uniref:Swiss Army Knife RNA repair protein HAD domain-containing protein n=1 Tax=Saccharata proteae CBS 121410 TaxID=1314787 RepID=A0A9P4HTT8_9PEZI|nr:hypothetical protein K490DRAFT_44655 [Saccharata proteae CBS 121410]
MSAYAVANGAQNGALNGKTSSYTITALKRWSCDDKELPSVQQIKAIHVYDFDNTLFASPLPNKQVWNGPTIGQLQGPDIFTNGGWWHDARILACTGEGIAKEEARGYEGWWNEQIVQLVELSMQQKDAFTVLLTGRSEGAFAELVKRILRSKQLTFDMTCLKPAAGPLNQRFANTMAFKQELLKDLVYTYRDATEIRVYEDRPKHTKGFREFFTAFNKALLSPDPPINRKPITAEVIQVAENATTLDPLTEVAEVQRMINDHNVTVQSGQAPHARPYKINRTIFFTGYLLSPPTSELLTKSLLSNLPQVPEGEIRTLANSILITPRPCPTHIMARVGGIGAKQRWRISGISCFENRIWAAACSPVPSNSRIYTENHTPTLVLALRRGARPADANRISNWQPVPDDQAIEFESEVGEKALLTLEEERKPFYPSNNKRPRQSYRDRDDRRGPPYNDENRRAQNHNNSGNNHNYRGGNHSRGRGHHSGARGRDGGRGGRGGRGGGKGRGRGQGSYRSLDDVRDTGAGNVGYDDGGYQY